MKKWPDYKIYSVRCTPSILFTIWNYSLPSLISLLTAHEETTHFVCFSCFLHSILTVLVSFCLFFIWLSRDQGRERNEIQAEGTIIITLALQFPVIDWSCFRDHQSLLFMCISHGIHLDLEDSNSLDMSLLKVQS